VDPAAVVQDVKSEIGEKVLPLRCASRSASTSIEPRRQGRDQVEPHRDEAAARTARFIITDFP